jgi:hypothetical protein
MPVVFESPAMFDRTTITGRCKVLVVVYTIRISAAWDHMFDMAIVSGNCRLAVAANMFLFLAQGCAHLLMAGCAHESTPVLRQ